MSEGPASLVAFGFDPFFEAALDKVDGGRVAARIAIAHGESYIAWTARGVRKAMIVGRRLAAWTTAAERPQVGDWVAGADSDSSGALVIEHLLPRRTCLVRRAVGERGDAQVIAANVDVVGIVTALAEASDAGGGRRLINEGQLGRYLAAVEQSHATPVLIVNKSDLSAASEEIAEGLRRTFPGVPVASTSGRSEGGIAGLAAHLRDGQTLVLVGMSGVGKSTLVNALLERSAQRVGGVRESDDRGRHTTTHRELFVTRTGALLIDTPGMRELTVWDPSAVNDWERPKPSHEGARGKRRGRR